MPHNRAFVESGFEAFLLLLLCVAWLHDDGEPVFKKAKPIDNNPIFLFLFKVT